VFTDRTGLCIDTSMKSFKKWLEAKGVPNTASILQQNKKLGWDLGQSGFQQLDRGQQRQDQVGISPDDAASQWLDSPSGRLAGVYVNRFMQNSGLRDNNELRRELEKAAREELEKEGTTSSKDVFLRMSDVVNRPRLAVPK